MPAESRSLSPTRTTRPRKPGVKRTLSADRSPDHLLGNVLDSTRGLLRTVSTDGYDTGFLSLFGLSTGNERKSADRDKTYFNILGTDGLVSTDHVQQEIELARTTESITQLELEDIVCRKQSQKLIFWAIQKLLSNDDRPWQSIKFTDTFHFFSNTHASPRSMAQLLDYETKQQQLWELMSKKKSGGNDNATTTKLLSFEVKVLIDEGSNIDTFVKLMRQLHNHSKTLQRVEFGGAGLYGCSQKEVPGKLASLFQEDEAKDDDDKDQEYPYFSLESVSIDLWYGAPANTKNSESKEKLNELLEKCMKKMAKVIKKERERSSSPKKENNKSPKRSKSKSKPERSRSSSPKPEKSTSRSPSPKPSSKPLGSSATSPNPGGGKAAEIKLLRSISTPPPTKLSGTSTGSKERKSRKDRIKNGKRTKRGGSNSNEDDSKSLTSATSHDKRTRPRFQRQNTAPETLRDIKFTRRNSPPFRWEKYQGSLLAQQQKKKQRGRVAVVVDLQKDMKEYRWDDPSHNSPPSA